jgi:hypothetical protein
VSARERLARAAAWLLAPPERGEPVHTALDASQGSMPRFVRELAGLTWYGYRRRATDIVNTPASRVFADGLAQGAVWILVFELADLLAHLRIGGHGPLDSWPAALLLALALALALSGLDRLAGLAGLGWVVVWTPILGQYRTPAGLTALLVPLLGFLVLVVAPRRRTLDPRRLLWLALPVALVLTTGPGSSGAFLVWLPVVLLVLGAAMLMLPTDPRLALAAAMPITYVGSQHVDRPSSIPLISTVFVVLAVAVLLRRLRPLAIRSSRI